MHFTDLQKDGLRNEVGYRDPLASKKISIITNVIRAFFLQLILNKQYFDLALRVEANRHD